MKRDSIRNKYDILGFTFSCFHECHEGRYGKNRCSHCISRRKCVNEIRPVYPSEEGIYYPTERIELSAQHAEDLGTYVHEFTEATIIQVFKRLRKDWHRDVAFKGFKPTYIAHLISMYGTNNNTCLEPITRRNIPKW